MSLIIPGLLLLLVACSLFRGVGVYDSFVRGAMKAVPMLVQVLPYMAAMFAALNIFRTSGALGMLINAFAPVLNAVGVPEELAPLIVLRPFSGSAALALLEDVYKTSGVDSQAGIMASVMLGSTETIFYTIALYFGSIGIKKTRHSIPAALISGAAGVAASVILTRIFF